MSEWFTLYAASYTDGFIDFWSKAFRKTDNIVLLALGIAVVCIGIIMSSGKWKK